LTGEWGLRRALDDTVLKHLVQLDWTHNARLHAICQHAIVALELVTEGNYCSHLNPEALLYTKCENYSVHNVCNWLVPTEPCSKRLAD